MKLSPNTLSELVKYFSLYTTKPLINPVWMRVKGDSVYSLGWDSGQTIIAEQMFKKVKGELEDGEFTIPPQSVVKALSSGFVGDKEIEVNWIKQSEGEKLVIKGGIDVFEHEIPQVEGREKHFTIKPVDKSIIVEIDGVSQKLNAVYKTNVDTFYKLFSTGEFTIEYSKDGLKFKFLTELSKFIRTLPVETVEFNKPGVVALEVSNLKSLYKFLEGNILIGISENFVVIRRVSENMIQNFILATKEIL